MTPNEVRAEVRSLIGKPSSDTSLTNDFIDRVAHQAMVKMFRFGKPVHARVSYDQNLVANQSDYYLPDKVLDILAVLVSDGTTFSRVPRTTQEAMDEMHSARWMEEGSSHRQVYLNAGVETTSGSDYGKLKITLTPPSRANVTNGLRVRYRRRPNKFSELADLDTEIVDIPLDFQDAMVYYVAFRHLSGQKERVRDANVYLQLFEQQRIDFAAEVAEMWADDLAVAQFSPRGAADDYWSEF